jgi:hypothetical protein
MDVALMDQRNKKSVCYVDHGTRKRVTDNFTVVPSDRVFGDLAYGKLILLPYSLPSDETKERQLF